MSKAELSRLMRGLSTKDGESDDPSAGAKEHKFWDTQPVPKMGEQIKDHGPIETKTVAEVQAEPYPLPAGFEWSDCDMTDERTVRAHCPPMLCGWFFFVCPVVTAHRRADLFWW